MNQSRIALSSQDILEKEFKIDTRGYRPQEVDRFLDIIIKDYEQMNIIINELESEKKDLISDNIKLKQENRNLKTKLDIISEEGSNDSTNSSNVDVLKRLSNLEKIIYGKE